MTDEKTDFYKILKIKKNATSEQIKKSYRRLAKKHHPDKGGDMQEFIKIQTAYRILYDSETRKQYDITGEWSEKKLFTEAEKTIQVLAQMYEKVILNQDTNENTDLKKIIIEALKNDKENISKILEQIEGKLKYLNSLLGRLQNKDDKKENVFDKVTRSSIQKMEAKKTEGEYELKIRKLAIDEMENYDSVFEAFSSASIRSGGVHFVSLYTTTSTTS